MESGVGFYARLRKEKAEIPNNWQMNYDKSRRSQSRPVFCYLFAFR